MTVPFNHVDLYLFPWYHFTSIDSMKVLSMLMFHCFHLIPFTFDDICFFSSIFIFSQSTLFIHQCSCSCCWYFSFCSVVLSHSFLSIVESSVVSVQFYICCVVSFSSIHWRSFLLIDCLTTSYDLLFHLISLILFMVSFLLHCHSFFVTFLSFFLRSFPKQFCCVVTEKCWGIENRTKSRFVAKKLYEVMFKI